MYRVETESELETWKNSSDSRIVIKKFDYDGRLKDGIIKGRQTFTLSAQERRINSEMASSESLDAFRNGTLLPVQLVESADDLGQIQENPNLMSETDMEELVDGHHKKLTARLAEVTSAATVKRLVEVAESRETTTGKLKAVKDRLEELAPERADAGEGDGTDLKPHSI